MSVLPWMLAWPRSARMPPPGRPTLRFYNMLRVAKGSLPMSIGTWTMSFGAFAGLSAAAQVAADRFGWRWLRRMARVAQVPAAATAAGLGAYTASLLAATSTPLWAAAPRALAVRFGSSSLASAAALSLGERSAGTRRTLDAIAVTFLATELATTVSAHASYERKGVAEALQEVGGRPRRSVRPASGPCCRLASMRHP